MRGLVALVTGAAGSLGKATVETLLANGMKVVAFDKRPFLQSEKFAPDIFRNISLTSAIADFNRIRVDSKKFGKTSSSASSFDDVFESDFFSNSKKSSFYDEIEVGRERFVDSSTQTPLNNNNPGDKFQHNETKQDNASDTEEDLSDDKKPFFEGQDHLNCVEIIGDVTSPDDVSEAIEAAVDEWNQLNVVVNCAGLTSTVLIYNKTSDHVVDLNLCKGMIDANTKGTFNVNRLASKVMANNDPESPCGRGVIINTSTSYLSDKGGSHFASSCGAIDGMTLPMCRDLAGLGIRVVTIAPGLFESRLISNKPPEDVIQYLGQVNVFPNRLGRAEEYSHLVTSIINNQMLNGVTIKIDAGLRFPFD